MDYHIHYKLLAISEIAIPEMAFKKNTTFGELITFHQTVKSSHLRLKLKKILFQDAQSRFMKSLKQNGFQTDKYPPILESMSLSLINSQPLDFSNLNLTGINFSRGALTDINFTDSNLEDAEFIDCTFDQVDFTGATLEGARFKPTHFKDVNFTNCDLSNAVFKLTNPRQVCNDVTLSRSMMGSAELNYFHTLGVRDFSRIIILGLIKNVHLQNSNLDGAIFSHDAIDSIDLTGSTLINLSFRGHLPLSPSSDYSFDLVPPIKVSCATVDQRALRFVYDQSSHQKMFPRSKKITFTPECFTGVSLTKKDIHNLYHMGARNFSGARLSGNLKDLVFDEPLILTGVAIKAKSRLNAKSALYLAKQCGYALFSGCVMGHKSIKTILAENHGHILKGVSIDTPTFKKLIKSGVSRFDQLNLNLTSVCLSGIDIRPLSLNPKMMSPKTINSITYKDQKVLLMLQCLKGINANTISWNNRFFDPIRENPIYLQDQTIQVEVAEIQLFTIILESKKGTWIPLPPIALRPLIQDWINTLSESNTDSSLFQLISCHSEYLNIILYQGSHSTDPSIQKATQQLRDLIYQVPEIQSIFITCGMGDEEAPYSNSYLYVSQDEQQGVILGDDYFEKWMSQPSQRSYLDWGNCAFFNKPTSSSDYVNQSRSELSHGLSGAFNGIPSLYDAYSSLSSPLPLDAFVEALFNLLSCDDLSFKDLILRVIQSGSSSVKLVDSVSQTKLHDLFTQFYIPDSDPLCLNQEVITIIHKISKTDSNENTAIILACLSWAFTRLSTESMLGTESDSPTAFRMFSVACLNTMTRLSPTLISNEISAQWMATLQQNSCSAVLSNHIQRKMTLTDDQSLRQIFSLMKPKSW